MILLRYLLGDVLRRRRQRQGRTLREVSAAARLSLGYLSEVERGQKEASSELLASICEALGIRLSDVLSDVAEQVAAFEPVPATPQTVGDGAAMPASPEPTLPSAPETVAAGAAPAGAGASVRPDVFTGAIGSSHSSLRPTTSRRGALGDAFPSIRI